MVDLVVVATLTFQNNHGNYTATYKLEVHHGKEAWKQSTNQQTGLMDIRMLAVKYLATESAKVVVLSGRIFDVALPTQVVAMVILYRFMGVVYVP